MNMPCALSGAWLRRIIALHSCRPQAGCKIKSVRVKDKELAEDKIPTEEGVKKKPNRYQATLSVPLEFPAPSRKRGPS